MADNKLQSLTEIFNQKIFRIPDFQRGYSWEEDQLEDFWEDVINLKEEKVHYTGLLTVEPIDKKSVQKIEKWQDDLWLLEKGLSAYYIVDGQQRLTTSIILINEILSKFGDDEGINFDTKEFWVNKFLYKEFGADYKSYIFGYEKDNPSDEYFKTKILEQHSSSADKVPEQTLYTSNLKFAKTFFSKKLKKLEKDQIENIFKKLVNRLKFNFFEIDEELDVYVTFETMNYRGKSLSNLELLKNRLIYLSTLLPDEFATRTRLRKDINEVWKTIYEFLGKDKDNPLDDDYFLYNHWIMYFKYDRSKSDAYAHFLLHEKFTAKAVIKGELDLQEIKEYIDSLSESVKAWFYLYNISYSSYSEETKEWVQKLDRLGMGAFPPLFMAAMTKESDEAKLLDLFKAAEKFIFLVFRLSQRPSNTKNSHFYRLANMYYFDQDHWGQGTTDIEKVIGNINWHTEGYDSEEEYVGWFDLWKFQSYIKELGQKEEGYYSWNGLRYFLYEYELYLTDKAKGNTKVTWTDFNKRKKEDTIEHIYPQTPKDECWKEAFKENDKKQKKALLNSLGNLLLLGQSKNSELQNKCFDFKKKHKNSKGDEVGFFNGSYSEISVSSYKDWTAKEIRERGLKMLDFLEERWGIDIADWEIEKVDLLNLNFDDKTE
jgi:uncharacterized protein with ParB-like and HNH nuclease domain